MTVLVTSAILSGLSPAEAAALWKVQQDSGAPVEAGLFDAWLADDANAAAWAGLEGAWSMFDMSEDPMFDDVRRAALSVRPARGETTRWRPFAAAAAMIAIVCGAGLLLPRGGRVPIDANAHATEIAVTSGDTVRAFLLPDGSRMTLDVRSEARISRNGGRQVALDRGRALFSVRHDPARPFSVTARNRTIIDVGTRFEVGVSARAVRVALFEGSVRVEGGTGGTTLLRPGQTLVADAGKPDSVSSRGADAGALWRKGLAEFDNATLAEAVEQLNAGSDVKLLIMDPRLAGLHVSGQFRLRDPLRFATTVAEILPVRVVRVGRARIELRYRR